MNQLTTIAALPSMVTALVPAGSPPPGSTDAFAAMAAKTFHPDDVITSADTGLWLRKGD